MEDFSNKGINMDKKWKCFSSTDDQEHVYCMTLEGLIPEGWDRDMQWVHSKEQAEYIARAVNCHERLVEMLDDALDEIIDAGYPDIRVREFIRDACDLITAAKGGNSDCS